MAVNKVIYAGNTLIDLSGDTITPEDLAKGVTAHDKSGKKITGTSASLPDGISALASGTVTVASDSTYEIVTHNLGVIPDFIAWMIQDDTSTGTLTTTAVCGVTFGKTIGLFDFQYLVRGYGSGGSAAGTTGSSSDASYMTTTQARMVAHSNYKLIAGKTYRWVCGVMDGIL